MQVAQVRHILQRTHCLHDSSQTAQDADDMQVNIIVCPAEGV